MSEDLAVSTGTKEEQYVELIPQIAALVEGETDLIANLANVTAALKQQFNWLWVGFYLVKGGELVLGPFQGSHCLHADPTGQGGMRCSMGTNENHNCSGCKFFSRTHHLQQRL